MAFYKRNGERFFRQVPLGTLLQHKLRNSAPSSTSFRYKLIGSDSIRRRISFQEAVSHIGILIEEGACYRDIGIDQYDFYVDLPEVKRWR